MEHVREVGGCWIAAAKGYVRLSFEQKGIEVWLSPGQANGLGEALQRAAVSVGAPPIGGVVDRERFIQGLERIYQERNKADDEEAP